MSIDICANYPDSYRYEDEGDPRLDELTSAQAEAWRGYLQTEDDPMPLSQWLEVQSEVENDR